MTIELRNNYDITMDVGSVMYWEGENQIHICGSDGSVTVGGIDADDMMQLIRNCICPPSNILDDFKQPWSKKSLKEVHEALGKYLALEEKVSK
tara:strand:- start:131 stop:409 length:279 start_codon:yes stop_codon:yes gene_type:complete